MKSHKMKISTLVGAMALAGAVTLPSMAMAEVGDTSFSIFLRSQVELTNASGDIAEAGAGDGWHIADGSANGRTDTAGWSGLFFDIGHQISEDTKAIGRYSRNFNTSGDAGNRDVWIGLQSKRFGKLTAGRHGTPYKNSTLGWDPFNATFLQARGNQGRAGTVFGSNSFLDDSINYEHSLSGIKLAAMIGIDDSKAADGDTNGDRLLSFALTAPVGPVDLVVSYIDASEYAGRADDSTATKLGARFSEGALTLAAQYEMRDEGFEDGDFAFLTGSYKMGKWTHSINYGQFMDDSTADNDGDYFAIGTKYTWTRIVSVHVGYKRTERDIQGDDNVFGLGLRVGLNTGNLLAR
jgi:predicted porin